PMGTDMEKQSELKPAALSREWQALKPDWDIITALLGGSRRLREAATTYLPPHPRESAEAYRAPLSAATLYNGLEAAVNGVVSRVFAEPVVVKEESAQPFKDAAEDITGLGENLDGFARRTFESAVANGISWVLIDMPQIAPEIEEEVDGKKIV